MDPKELPKFKAIAGKLYLLAPIVSLVVFLVVGFSPYMASFYSIVISVVLAFINSEVKLNYKTVFDIIVTCGKRAAMIAIACATAGIIIGVITLTGFGLSLSSLILSLSGGNIALALILMMFTCIVMGTGTPTTVAYILVATLGVPVMQNLGLPLIASHLFVFYFAVISMITPPVAIAAFAAAEIAEEDPIKVGFTAMRLAVIIYVIPFIFLFDPTLLLMGEFGETVFRFLAICSGIILISGGMTRWFMRRLKLYEEIILVIFGLGGLVPFLPSNVVSIVMVCLVFFLQRFVFRAKNKVVA